MKKSLAVATVLVASVFGAPTALAADEHNTAPGLTAAGAPLG